MLEEKHILRVNSPGFGTERTLEHTSAEILSEYRVIVIDPVSPVRIMPRLALEITGIEQLIKAGRYSCAHIPIDLRPWLDELNTRKYQLSKFFEIGGLLVCFLRQDFHITDNNNRRLTNYDWLGPSFSLRERHKGSKLVLTQKGLENPFAAYLKLPEISWDACAAWISTERAPLVLAVNNDNDTVAFIIKYGKGEAVFLPKSSAPNADKILIECIREEYTKISFEEEPTDTWVEKYCVPGMTQLEEDISDLRVQIAQVKEREGAKENELKTLKKYRNVLLNGKGRILQHTVIDVLKEMGIDATPGPEGRDDIIINEGEKVVAVCEVKGVKKSAGEGDAVQLSKWVDRVYVEKKYVPKGMLIVNAFNEKDVPERIAKPFPDQMLPYCLDRRYCLLTTVQLFNIFCEFRRGSIDGKSILKEWIDCNGVYDKYHDIQPNLSKGSGD